MVIFFINYFDFSKILNYVCDMKCHNIELPDSIENITVEGFKYYNIMQVFGFFETYYPIHPNLVKMNLRVIMRKFNPNSAGRYQKFVHEDDIINIVYSRKKLVEKYIIKRV